MNPKSKTQNPKLSAVNPKSKIQNPKSGRDAVVIGAARTPIGRFRGGFSSVSAPELGAVAIREALARSGLEAALVDEVIMGNVISAGLGQAPARQAALKAGVPASASAMTINKVCASGLEAAALASQHIALDVADIVVAGGMENMSAGPHILKEGRTGVRFGNATLLDATLHDGLWCAYEQVAMGNLAEKTAAKYGVTREDQDAFALRSHQRALAATAEGLFRDELVSVPVGPANRQEVVDKDECPRADTTLEGLAKLRPAFIESGTVTAGNAPGISDGAAALVLAAEDRAKEMGLRPLARITGYASVGIAPGDLFEAPAQAIRKLLARTSTTLADYDLMEINEAFAAQILANGKELGWDWEKVNVKGGAVALGHPIGATGARLLVTLIYALQQRGGGRGLAALCHGGGGAVALSIEVPG